MAIIFVARPSLCLSSMLKRSMSFSLRNRPSQHRIQVLLREPEKVASAPCHAEHDRSGAVGRPTWRSCLRKSSASIFITHQTTHARVRKRKLTRNDLTKTHYSFLQAQSYSGCVLESRVKEPHVLSPRLTDTSLPILNTHESDEASVSRYLFWQPRQCFKTTCMRISMNPPSDTSPDRHLSI